METCSESGCGQPVKVKSRRLCGSHYKHALDAERGPCSIEGCDDPQRSAGLCVKHYTRQLRYGDPLATQNIRGGDDAARLAKWVDRSGGPDVCHPWTASIDRVGYGNSTYAAEGRSIKAHVLAWILENGPVPEGHDIDHECHNIAKRAGLCPGGICEHRQCCNPRHLVAKTRRQHFDDTPSWKRPRGNASGKSKLTEDQAREVKTLLREGQLSRQEIAARYPHVSVYTVHNIARGLVWAWLDDEPAA